MNGKLTKEERRHLDDAKREKQVNKYVIQQIQELPPVCSSCRTKSKQLDHMQTSMRPDCTAGATSVQTLLPSLRGTSSEPTSLPPTKKRRALPRVSPALGSISLPLQKGGALSSRRNMKAR
uniref:Uncharacterized protein n=1 Tax=Opuntia streptacantha TaxID=393608 RepID=A0A7C9CQU7_OPUST